MDRKENAGADAEARLKAATQMKERAERLTGDNKLANTMALIGNNMLMKAMRLTGDDKLTAATVIEAIVKFEKWNAIAKALYFYNYIMTMQWPTLMQPSEQTDKSRHKGKTEEEAYNKQIIKDARERLVLKEKNLVPKDDKSTIKEVPGSESGAKEVRLQPHPLQGSFLALQGSILTLQGSILALQDSIFALKDSILADRILSTAAAIRSTPEHQNIIRTAEKLKGSSLNERYIDANTNPSESRKYSNVNSAGSKGSLDRSLAIFNSNPSKSFAVIKGYSSQSPELGSNGKIMTTKTNHSINASSLIKGSESFSSFGNKPASANALIKTSEKVNSLIRSYVNMSTSDFSNWTYVIPTESANIVRTYSRISSTIDDTYKKLFIKESKTKELSIQRPSTKGLGIQKQGIKGLITSKNVSSGTQNFLNITENAIGFENLLTNAELGLLPGKTGIEKLPMETILGSLTEKAERFCFFDTRSKERERSIVNTTNVLKGKDLLGFEGKAYAIPDVKNKDMIDNVVGKLFDIQKNEAAEIQSSIQTSIINLFNPAAQEPKTSNYYTKGDAYNTKARAPYTKGDAYYARRNVYTQTSQNASSSSNLYALTEFFDVRAQGTETSSFVGNGSKITQRPQAFISQFAKLYLPFTDIDNNETDRRHKLSAVSKAFESDDRKILKSQMFSGESKGGSENNITINIDIAHVDAHSQSDIRSMAEAVGEYLCDMLENG